MAVTLKGSVFIIALCNQYLLHEAETMSVCPSNRRVQSTVVQHNDVLKSSGAHGDAKTISTPQKVISLYCSDLPETLPHEALRFSERSDILIQRLYLFLFHPGTVSKPRVTKDEQEVLNESRVK